jgi:ELWxxDGT repeat protein
MPRIFYIQGNGPSAELWETDGAPSSDHEIPAKVAFGFDFTNCNNTLFFGVPLSLYKTDGSPAGTQLVESFAGGFDGNLTQTDSTVFFTADDGTHGSQLWKTDGTPGGTVMLTNAPGFGPNSLVNLAGTLYFAAFDSTGAEQLWTSDGTAAGTVPVTTDPFPGPRPTDLTILPGPVITLLNRVIQTSVLYYVGPPAPNDTTDNAGIWGLLSLETQPSLIGSVINPYDLAGQGMSGGTFVRTAITLPLFKPESEGQRD